MYHCMPPPSRDPSPARSESPMIDVPQSQPLARSLSRASSRAGSTIARSLSRSMSRDLGPLVPGLSRSSQSRSRSGSVEDDDQDDLLGPDGRDRSRSRSVSFAARSAGGIRAPVRGGGVRPRGGKAKVKAAPSLSVINKQGKSHSHVLFGLF